MSQAKLTTAREYLDSITDFLTWETYLNMLKEISNSTINDLATSVIDNKDKTFSQDYLNFFNDTLLSEIEFEDLDSNPFYIKNTRTQNRFAFSNRTTASELRGPRLWQYLTQARNFNHNLTLHEALINSIKEPTTADLHKYFISTDMLINMSEKNKAILIRSSRVAIAQFSTGKDLTIEALKSIVDEQHQLFHNCPEPLKSMHTQLMTTVETLENLLIEANLKRAQADKSDPELEKIIVQLRSAIITACDLLPDYDNSGKITYPINYQTRVNSYIEASNALANNPSLKQFSFSSYLGMSLFALGVLAITTCAAAILFPPAALFMSQALLHGIVSATAIEGTLAGAGVVAAGAGVSFFRKGNKFQGKEAMETLKVSNDEVVKSITASAA